MIIETVSGQSYEQYIQEHIFTPMDMRHTYTDPELARQEGLSCGYSRMFGVALPWKQMHRAYEIGAGYIISSAEDMAHFSIAMINEGDYKGTHLVNPATLQAMFDPVQGYGWGWFIIPGRINHGGSTEAFKTYVDLFPDEKIGIVLLINHGYMLDNYISAPQLKAGVESIVFGRTPTDILRGLSVRLLGYGLLVVTAGLAYLQIRNLLSLRTWKSRAHAWNKAEVYWDILMSFLIPSFIIAIVIWQMSEVLGDRFNLAYQVTHMFALLPDLGIVFVIGIVPFYLQGLIKIGWVAGRKID